MKNLKFKRAFSFIEISVVILIIVLLIAGITSGINMVGDFTLTTARSLTRSSPLARIPDLTAWWETTSKESFSIALINDSTKISTWQDINLQSPTKYNASQATSSAQPIYTEKAINGLPALKFDGSATYFEIPYHANLNPDNFSIFAVVSTSATTYWGSIITSRDENPLRGYMLYASPSSQYQSWIGTSSIEWSGWNIPGGAIKINSPSIISTICTKTTLTVYDSGAIRGSVTESLSPNKSKPLRIGAGITESSTPGLFYNGYIGELIIFSRALKSGERKSVESYLSQKWKIAVTQSN